MRNHVQSTAFGSDILSNNRSSFVNKLLRLKYADKKELLLLKGPFVQSWKNCT